MLGICGLNLVFDRDSLNPAFGNINNINHTTLKNGVIDKFYVTKNVTQWDVLDIPDTWDDETIMLALFENNINAGNIGYIKDSITSVKVQRARVDEIQPKWITIAEVDTSMQDIPKYNPFAFIVNDITNANGATYVYKLVPVLQQVQEDGQVVQIEGEGIPSDPVQSKFDGVFISDLDSSYKLKLGVGYNGLNQNQQVGVHQTIGGKYPIVVTNSKLNYADGGVTGMIINSDYGERTDEGYVGIDRGKIVQERDKVLKLLTNKKPKILKDWNNNIWLVMITGNPTVEFINEYGMGIANVSFTWVEIGDPNVEEDLIYSGLIGGGKR